MGQPAVGVVVAHGDLAAALVEAVERISGVRGGLHPVSNTGMTPGELEREVERAVGGAPAVVFVDMASGSCAFAGRRLARSLTGVSVVTGVSLPMLLDFVFHRDLDPGELARRVLEKGMDAASVVPPGDGDRESSDARRADPD